MKRAIFLISIFLLLPPALRARALSIKELKLEDLEKEVAQKSYEILTKKMEVEASLEKRESVVSLYMPKITMEGYYRYVAEVPSLNLAASRQLQFGDNDNYSIGPTLNMVVLDFGSRDKLQKSLQANVDSKKYELQTVTQNTLQKIRFHYVNLVLLSEKQSLVSESLKLAQDQLRDVENRSKFGSGTKVDLLSAKKEVHELMAQFKDTQSLMSVELAEIQQLQDMISFEGITSPIAESAENNFFQTKSYLRLDSFEKINERLSKYEHSVIDSKNHPRVKALNELAIAHELNAESVEKSHWPKLSLYARASIDYPNGPVKDDVNQKVVGINFSMPLFDGGEIRHNSQEKKAWANSLKAHRAQEEKTLASLHVLSLEKLKNLRDQKTIIQNKVAESKEIAELVYKSYKDGRATFLEVERANVKYRESKLHLSNNHFHILNHLIILAALSGEIYEIQ